MDSAEFRRHAEMVMEWIARYLTEAERYPVLSQVAPGDVRRALPTVPPEQGEAFDVIFTDFERVIVPALTHWNHPGFLAYFASSATEAGVLAEFLAAAVNQQAMLWRTSPAATELEEVALGWLRNLLELPDSFEGVIYDTASISSLHALAAARHAAVPEVRHEGLGAAPALRVYCSEHAHSSIDKAVILLGLGHRALRRIPADDCFSMRTIALREAIAEDRSAGIVPLAVVATIGTTSTTSVDPVAAVADICAENGIWLHVDAAYAGVSAMLPDYRSHFVGWERADSLVVNPHKWLFIPFDLSAFYCRRMELLRDAMSIVPEYLETVEGTRGVRNLMDTGIQLGRRFRALKLWMVLRHLGAQAIREKLAEHIRLAQLFSNWVDSDSDFERLAPVPFSVVCFRAHPKALATSEAVLNALNAELLDAINATGDVFLSHTHINNRYALRLAIGHPRTTEQHVARAWQLLRQLTAQLLATRK